MRPRKVPQRTCIGCRAVKDKRELLRIVRTADAEILFDETGKKSGRGAYVCRDYECLDAALQTKRLAKALRCTVTAEEIEQLRSQFEEIVR